MLQLPVVELKGMYERFSGVRDRAECLAGEQVASLVLMPLHPLISNSLHLGGRY